MKIDELMENTKFLIAAIVVVALMTCGVLYMVMSGRLSSSQSTSKPATATSTATPSPEKAREDEMKSLLGHLDNKPAHPPILFRMAQLSRDGGKLDDAIKYLKQVLDQEPDNVDAHLEIGRVLYEKGDPKGALAETEKILKKDPKNVDALYNLGAISANINEMAKAQDYWKKAVAVDAASESGKNAQAGLAQLSGVQPVQVAADSAPEAPAPQRATTFDPNIRIPRADAFRKQ